MIAVRRWGVVLLGATLLVAGPVAVRALPAAENDMDAAALLELVTAAQDRPWSGLVETEGGLQLPDASRFDDVATLFGERTRMRAWWQDEDHWRVDRLVATGGTVLVHDEGTTVAWDYERAQTTVSRDPDIRLPRTADLVPPALGQRLLRGVSAAEVERLPTRRVAGTSAPGMRITPTSALSSIDHADLWADPATGTPVRVDVYAEGDSTPSFTTAFRDFATERPDDGITAAGRVPGASVTFDDVLDIADAANQYAPVRPPASVAGLPIAPVSDRAVGVYGEGMTQVVAIPLRDREAGALRDQLAHTRGVVATPGRTTVSVGPLGVLLTGDPGQGGWLLAGTLTQAALARAADDLEAGFVYVGGAR